MSIVQAPNGAWWCTDCITRDNTRSELEQHPCHPEHQEDAMDLYQTALETNKCAFTSQMILHITAVGDANPICGRDDENLMLTQWSTTISQDDLRRILVVSEFVTCGKCSDIIWED